MIVHPLFENRTVAIVSKHQKERAILPVFKALLGCEMTVLDGFDTDKFGTFSGKIDRLKNPMDTIKDKCIAGLDNWDWELGVASEGSFGPHPFIPFITANEEWMILIDRKNGIEILERSISTKTNFNQEEIGHLGNLFGFAKRIGFPEHGIILKDAVENATHFVDRMDTIEALIEGFYRLKKVSKTVIAETDMRACYNPTRMAHIEELSRQLARSIKSECPQCQFPGFKVQHVISGLPCKFCETPTRKALKHIQECKRCGYLHTISYPAGIRCADPGDCDRCNP
jgi:hypothetical protein